MYSGLTIRLGYPKLIRHKLQSIQWVQSYGHFIFHVSWFVHGSSAAGSSTGTIFIGPWLVNTFYHILDNEIFHCIFNQYQPTHRPDSRNASASKNYQENLSSSSPYMVLVLLKNLNVRYKKSKKLLIQYKCNNWSLSPNMTFCVCSCSISHVGLTT